MTNFYINEKYLKELSNIFKTICPNATIWAYGSRVDGTAHSGSDLDLVVKTWGNSESKMSELKTAIENSNIPFLTDINDFILLPKSFQEQILKKYIEIYKNN